MLGRVAPRIAIRPRPHFRLARTLFFNWIQNESVHSPQRDQDYTVVVRPEEGFAFAVRRLRTARIDVHARQLFRQRGRSLEVWHWIKNVDGKCVSALMKYLLPSGCYTRLIFWDLRQLPALPLSRFLLVARVIWRGFHRGFRC